MKTKRYAELGFTYLLNIDQNAKTVKGNTEGFRTAILYLAPSNESGVDVCPYSSPGCVAGCLYTAGRGTMAGTKNARINRTHHLITNRVRFMVDLEQEIREAWEKATQDKVTLVVRLNGTSDIDWNFYYDGKQTIFSKFPTIQFYDYTKDYRKLERNKIPNYHLTYSYHENASKDKCFDVLHKHHGNVAVVYMTREQQREAVEVGAIDGEAHDLRFLDKPGKVVALLAKGKAKKDTTGFVINKGVAV